MPAILPDRSAFECPERWLEHNTVCQMSNVQPSGSQPLHAWRHDCNWLLQIYSKQNQSYAVEPKLPTKQKQMQTLKWCLEHPKNGVYATLNMVQHGIVQRTACGVPDTNITSRKVQCSSSIAAELLPLPVANS